jgi:hypothetical protein
MNDVHDLSKWVIIFNNHFSKISRDINMKKEIVYEGTDIFLFCVQDYKCSMLCPHITQTLFHLHDSSPTHKEVCQELTVVTTTATLIAYISSRVCGSRGRRGMIYLTVYVAI